MQKPTAPVTVFDGIYWVGALNPDLRRFDVVMETEYGTSYNAYLVQGTEKTALIETVKDKFLPESLELIRQVIDPAKIDYIILQHTEPDHSGSIAELLALAPQAKVCCTKPASLYLPHIANRPLPMQVVKEGDALDLGGGRVLQFVSAPFLHWPDSMFTYDTLSHALFTCDAFGCHYAAAQVLESRTDPEFHKARRYYYDCIVSPFAPYVTKAIAHVQELGLDISAILPSHGPVLDKDPMGAVALYGQWAAERKALGKNRVFVGYVSCYGYTRALAHRLAEQLMAQGMEVDMADLVDVPLEDLVNRVYEADAIAIGSPTVNADALPPVWDLLTRLSVPVMRGRVSAAFGSYGWSGEAVPLVEARLSALGCKAAAPGVKARFRPEEEALCQMDGLGQAIAKAVKGV